MQNTQRSVLVGLVFALGGVLVAGLSVRIVLARQRRGAAEEHPESEDPIGRTAPDDQISAGDVCSIDRAAQLPGDMRPEDPSYGPVI